MFHCMQVITRHFEDTDHLETYQNLSGCHFICRPSFALLIKPSATFLLNNCNWALHIIAKTPKLLAQMMKDLGISDASVFETWIVEEQLYLQGLKKEPAEEMLQMELQVLKW